MPESITWQPRRGVLRPVVAQDPPARRDLDIHSLIACPTCRARVDECCRTPSGHKTNPHRSRLAPRLCPCGEIPAPQRHYCEPCAAESIRISKRDYLRRRRARAKEEAA